MDSDQVAACVRERTGLDVQAITLARSRSGHAAMPSVWSAMTEHGQFWAVEHDEVVEIFRAATRKTPAHDTLACRSAREAARRFQELHPETGDGSAVPRADPSLSVAAPTALVASGGPAGDGFPGDGPTGGQTSCRSCGVRFTEPQPDSSTEVAPSARRLCPRCRHAEHERLRYRRDPAYRARRLAYGAAQYRRRSRTSADDA